MILTRAMIDRKSFSMTGLLDLKSPQIIFCVAAFFVVCLGHGIVHGVPLVFVQNQILGEA